MLKQCLVLYLVYKAKHERSVLPVLVHINYYTYSFADIYIKENDTKKVICCTLCSNSINKVLSCSSTFVRAQKDLLRPEGKLGLKKLECSGQHLHLSPTKQLWNELLHQDKFSLSTY